MFFGQPRDSIGIDPSDVPIVLEVFSNSTQGWYVAIVVANTDGALTVRFVDEQGERREKGAYCKDPRTAYFGTHTGWAAPPGVTTMPSATRPGQVSYLDQVAQQKFATAELAWQAYLERHLVAVDLRTPLPPVHPAPVPVPQPVEPLAPSQSLSQNSSQTPSMPHQTSWGTGSGPSTPARERIVAGGPPSSHQAVGADSDEAVWHALQSTGWPPQSPAQVQAAPSLPVSWQDGRVTQEECFTSEEASTLVGIEIDRDGFLDREPVPEVPPAREAASNGWLQQSPLQPQPVQQRPLPQLSEEPLRTTPLRPRPLQVPEGPIVVPQRIPENKKVKVLSAELPDGPSQPAAEAQQASYQPQHIPRPCSVQMSLAAPQPSLPAGHCHVPAQSAGVPHHCEGAAQHHPSAARSHPGPRPAYGAPPAAAVASNAFAVPSEELWIPREAPVASGYGGPCMKPSRPPPSVEHHQAPCSRPAVPLGSKVELPNFAGASVGGGQSSQDAYLTAHGVPPQPFFPRSHPGLGPRNSWDDALLADPFAAETAVRLQAKLQHPPSIWQTRPVVPMQKEEHHLLHGPPSHSGPERLLAGPPPRGGR